MYKFKAKKSNGNIFLTEKNVGSDNEDETEDEKTKKITSESNHIYFHSEVTRNSIFELIEKIRKCEIDNIILAHKLCCDPIPIYLHINSFGGCVFSALHAIDILNSCKVPIYSIIEGATASAGTLISIVATKRFIRPNAQMLIHQLSSGSWGKMQELEDDFENNKYLMDKIIKLYQDYASIPKKQLKDILKHDLWWDSKTCLKYGLVDEIWEKI